MRVAQCLAFVAIGAGLMWFYDFAHGMSGGQTHNSKEQLAAYEGQIGKLTAERDRFNSTVNAAESQLNMERAAQRQLAAQVKQLEADNMRLKEDLAFFESLLPNAAGAQGIAIRRLKIDPVAPNQLRYRLLIMQGGKGDQDFKGNLQLTVTAWQGGKSSLINFPDATAVEQEKFKLNFRHYQRVEGVLRLPEGTSVKAVQARVLDKGQLKAQQSANL
ncbi:hypothetical protein G3574_24430 [Noviherbaspirillum sp. 17J57-3]|uniref:Uncharacterized protein n=2 Tax=Noviherbaspirillum galbum TaxID=2709383 RepID=A0A6B3SZ17_9BURK|nr:hypothetical protein [Noviherbaspirillum galbum]